MPIGLARTVGAFRKHPTGMSPVPSLPSALLRRPWRLGRPPEEILAKDGGLLDSSKVVLEIRCRYIPTTGRRDRPKTFWACPPFGP